ncbi:flagellar hook-length control protein FliK [Rhodovulum sulfidophilum]|uniref:Flagellar hook-length control protein FliK n=1 Tax=Rhodovulum sulfidophilum TaxID=35806 RepID=A0ABS1RWI3_RHOSU|nr:flagellar hook-length control protein FliK [Rhodovulum sulfidophilum]MBL3610461.1 flagellar hook-length control protein FliK [Rhodovulum sulfidophilum]MCE8456292.1 flagellar hook-length control protein FliK [Rhodovulum sulfidophilum]
MQVPFPIDTLGASASSRPDRSASNAGAADPDGSDFRSAFDDTRPSDRNETAREAARRDTPRTSAASDRAEETPSSAPPGARKNSEDSAEEIDETAATKAGSDTVKNDPAAASDAIIAELPAMAGFSTAPQPGTGAATKTQALPTETAAAGAGTTAASAGSDMARTTSVPLTADPRQQLAESQPNAALPASSPMADARPVIATGGTTAQQTAAQQAEDTGPQSDIAPSGSKDAKAAAASSSTAAAQANAAPLLPGTSPEALQADNKEGATLNSATPKDSTTNRSSPEIADATPEAVAPKEGSTGQTASRQGDGMLQGREAAQSQAVAARTIASDDPATDPKGDQKGHASAHRENTSATPTTPTAPHATAAQPDATASAPPIAGTAIDIQTAIDGSRGDPTAATDSGASERSGSDQIRGSETARHTAAPALADTPRTAIRQIAESLHRASDGSVHLTLSPEELGRVRLSLTPGDHGITVNISADRADTLDLMRRHGDTLANAMRDLGYGEVVLDFTGRQNNAPGQGRGFAAAGPTPNEEGTETGLLSANRTSPRTAGGGLDLRL